MKRKFLYLIFFIGALVIGSFLFWQVGWYHILNVNGARIRASDYFGRLYGYEHYRRLAKEESDEDAVKKGIIFSIIKDELIKNKLAELDVKDDEIASRFERDLEGEADGDFEKAAKELYGWNRRQSIKFLALPRIREDILAERLEKEGKNFSEWLKSALKEADIKIHYLPYVWKNGEVVGK